MVAELVAIHQPNFFPWLGYFDKIARADTFVLLDDAQFPKKGGTWINRVRMLVNGRAVWVTAPVVRSYHGMRAINEMLIEEAKPWREKLLKTIEHSYAKSTHYEELEPWLQRFVGNGTKRLAEYNIEAISSLVAELGLSAKLVRSSDLEVEGVATDRLIEITRAVGGDAYLAGGGASGYQEDEKFEADGVELVYQDFSHPVYEQPGEEFVPGLSVIDALLNCGLAGVRELLAAEP